MIRISWCGILKLAILLFLVTFHSIGCGTTSGIEGRGATVQEQSPSVSLDQRLVVNNKGLARDIQIIDQKAAFAGDLLKASVTLLSKISTTLNLQYKFAWFDGQGIEINPDSGSWKPLVLYGKEEKTLQAVAPNPSAKEFKIMVREQ